MTSRLTLKSRYILPCLLLPLLANAPAAGRPAAGRQAALAPVVVTDAVTDTDDPAFWINPADPAKSLVLGTDKGGGALCVYGLDGHLIADRIVRGLLRPNNVDVEYGLKLKGVPTDIAVVTERDTSKLRVYSLPDMRPVDGGGIEVFEGQSMRDPMGIGLYKRPSDGTIFAILSRKRGPRKGYLWEYRLEDDGTGAVRGVKVREFGAWTGGMDLEAVAVDDPLGYVYYADERAGVRKYRADPDAPDADRELALFATSGFGFDREGIAIYQVNDGTGYILVADQVAPTRFHVFRREGEPGDPHRHREIKVVPVQARHCDGADVTSTALGERFPAGLFAAMSSNGTFHFYSWQDVAGEDLALAPNGVLARPERRAGAKDGGAGR